MITEVRYEPTCAYCKEPECICDEIERDLQDMAATDDEWQEEDVRDYETLSDREATARDYGCHLYGDPFTGR